MKKASLYAKHKQGAGGVMPRSPHLASGTHFTARLPTPSGLRPSCSGCHLFTAHGAGSNPAPSPALYLRKRDKTPNRLEYLKLLGNKKHKPEILRISELELDVVTRHVSRLRSRVYLLVVASLVVAYLLGVCLLYTSPSPRDS